MLCSHRFERTKENVCHCRLCPPKYTVFNVGGNEYRVVLHIHYNTQRAFVRFVGAHAEYNSWTKRNR
ncbi:type II toxin-antitoxin system HigB family toxin [Massilia cavernae]|uniref:Type II toxin-antitoxin system HigB family toxin n=1 Tax=Massilia cavernae TaxID=2320864 RepID=A0A418XFJ4_9BURK|nr:type II toxin-antitoxin system HigB family toxin [Massilia cavernae]